MTRIATDWYIYTIHGHYQIYQIPQIGDLLAHNTSRYVGWMFTYFRKNVHLLQHAQNVDTRVYEHNKTPMHSDLGLVLNKYSMSSCAHSLSFQNSLLPLMAPSGLAGQDVLTTICSFKTSDSSMVSLPPLHVINVSVCEHAFICFLCKHSKL